MSTATAHEQRYMAYPAAARYTGMSEQTLRRAVDAGKLKVYRPTRPTGGRLVVFDVRELDAFIRGGPEQAAK
jgi:excisionase family DNA binding protein